MDIFQSPKQLIQKILKMFSCQVVVRFDNLMQIRFHQFEHNVDVFEGPWRWRQHNVLDFDYIRMAQEPKNFDLSKNPCRIRHMLEDVIDLFDRHLLTCKGVDCGAHQPIASLPDHLLYLITISFSVLGKEIDLHHTAGVFSINAPNEACGQQANGRIVRGLPEKVAQGTENRAGAQTRRKCRPGEGKQITNMGMSSRFFVGAQKTSPSNGETGGEDGHFCG